METMYNVVFKNTDGKETNEYKLKSIIQFWKCSRKKAEDFIKFKEDDNR